MKTLGQYWIPWLAACLLVHFPTYGDVPEFTGEGFRIPQPNTRLSFPRDHGSHPDYKIEWWYLTGHLQSEEGDPFGFQATFFRFAAPLNDATPYPKAFGRSHLFSSQVALTHISAGEFLMDERLDRNGWDVYSNTDSLSIRHGPWTLEMIDIDNEIMDLNFTIRDRASIYLQMIPKKPLVMFGEDGTSRKGPDPSARSFYLTFPRLAVEGEMILDGKSQAVTGEAWMDHEIASRQLSENLEGWDWTAIQLEDGREIKAYLLRQSDGNPSPYSHLMWIDSFGKVTYQSYGEFDWQKKEIWTSPNSGAEYPTTVQIETEDPQNGRKRQFRLVPKLANQEVRGDLNGTYYWEGACRVVDEKGQLVGNAYLELAGYGNGLSDRLK